MADADVDYYELLGVASTASEVEIKTAYRKTSLKYHPDKNPEGRETFDLLSIARDVLLDEKARELYDHTRRSKAEKKERDAAYDGRRRAMKEDLERRESAGIKRARDEVNEEEAVQRKIRRLAADGARRRQERAEQLRKEAQAQAEEESEPGNTDAVNSPAPVRPTGADAEDRTITLRFANTGEGLGEEALKERFGRFGKIENVVLRNKKIKVEGEKHRREYTTAIIEFQSIVGAHAAVTDIPRLQSTDASSWAMFEGVNWAAGKEPDCIPKPASSKPQSERPINEHARPPVPGSFSTPTKTNIDRFKDSAAGLRKVPSFGSFKGTPKRTLDESAGVAGSPSMDELMMIRLKNAERKKMAEKLRQEDLEAGE